jgi:hypothetical protein
MKASQTDPRVDKYIETLPTWQQAICRKIRKLIHEADPEVVETIKRKKLPYFTLAGNICALLATRDHVNVFIYDPIASDPARIINQGEANKTARAIQIYQDEKFNESGFVKLIKNVIANNRVGGWRKIKS